MTTRKSFCASSDVDRVLRASADFSKDDNYRAQKRDRRIQPLWDHFRRFAGFLPSTANSDGSENIQAFLKNPEKGVKTFLSSYADTKGLLRVEFNITAMPRIVSSFLSFLLRHDYLPGLQQKLVDAIKAADSATVNLSLSLNLCRDIPDEFHRGCHSCWGPKAQSYMPFVPSSGDQVEHKDRPNFKRPSVGPGDERDSKRRNVDHGDRGNHKKSGYPLIPARRDDQIWSGWSGRSWAGEGGSGWNGSGWGGSGGSWGVDAGTLDSAASAWAPTIYSLMRLLGPTTFPITHTTGTVEVSLRRVKSFTAPPSTALTAANLTDAVGVANPDAVEVVLESQFAQVVLEPWHKWDPGYTGPYADPKILGSSNKTGTTTSHDPFEDDIMVLVSRSVIESWDESLGVGLGVGATWVQLIHETPEGLGVGGSSVKESEGKEKEMRGRFWYVEEVMMTLPSHYVPLDLGIAR